MSSPTICGQVENIITALNDMNLVSPALQAPAPRHVAFIPQKYMPDRIDQVLLKSFVKLVLLCEKARIPRDRIWLEVRNDNETKIHPMSYQHVHASNFAGGVLVPLLRDSACMSESDPFNRLQLALFQAINLIQCRELFQRNYMSSSVQNGVVYSKYVQSDVSVPQDNTFNSNSAEHSGVTSGFRAYSQPHQGISQNLGDYARDQRDRNWGDDGNNGHVSFETRKEILYFQRTEWVHYFFCLLICFILYIFFA
ncbi:hypothetical protein K445DRAFT_236875 [Daldinia sp. EC12]|nr:hypothetical protein K445DRAFT_236875 [Daldinia sp. EC12]